MSFFVFYNGDYLAEEKVCIPVSDRGFLFGEALLETLKATKDASGLFKPIFLNEHLARLRKSAKTLEIPILPSDNDFYEILKQLFFLHRDLAVQSYTVRIFLSGNGSGIGDWMQPAKTSNILISIKPLHAYEMELYTNGGILGVSQTVQADTFFGQFKLLNPFWRLFARREALKNQVVDMLVLNANKDLIETGTGNIFLVENGALKTPKLQGGALPGITREKVLELAAEKEILSSEQSLRFSDLENADEIFITNSLKGILPIASVHKIDKIFKAPGEKTKILISAYDQLLSRS